MQTTTQTPDFDDLLLRAGINRAELGRRLGVSPETISRWTSSVEGRISRGVPGYAIAYLGLLIEHNRVTAAVQTDIDAVRASAAAECERLQSRIAELEATIRVIRTVT